MGKARNEWKYICNDKQLALLQNKLNAILDADIHTDSNKTYVVRSLYFDNYFNKCARVVESGSDIKFKWRIRYYNIDYDTLKLEYKYKKNGRGIKYSTFITKDIYDILVSGDVSTLLYDTDDELVRKFCVDILMHNYRPKVIIDYERIAYNEKNLNVRITIDKNISSSYEFNKFLSDKYIKFPLQNGKEHVLEVKFDDILPGYIKKILDSDCGSRISFSKYYNGRKMINEVY